MLFQEKGEVMSAFFILAILQYQPGSSGDSGLVGIIVLVLVGFFFVAIIAFTIGAIIYAANKRKDRAAKLKALAQQIGFAFVPKPGVPDFLKGTRFAQWSPAVATGIHNLLSGSLNGRTVFVFDFGYTKTMGGFGSATYRETVVCLPRDSGEPFIFYRQKALVAPENIRTFLNSALQAFHAGAMAGASN